MPPVDQRELGRFIRQHRGGQGLSLRELADKSGVSYTTIFRWEEGTYSVPKVEMLERLAPHLGVRLTDLFAVAGLAMPSGLPELGPYLRRKYDLPVEAAGEVEQYLETLRDRYGVGPTRARKGGRRGQSRR